MRNQAATTRIRNADWVVAFDAAAGKHVYRRGIDVEFSGNTITHVGATRAAVADKEIDGRGLMVMPGPDRCSRPSDERIPAEGPDRRGGQPEALQQLAL